MNFVRPVRMQAPSGEMAQPRIVNRESGDKIIVEAQWYDPRTGIFFHKGTVEIKEK